MVLYVVGTTDLSGVRGAAMPPAQPEDTRVFMCLRPTLASLDRFVSGLYAMRYRHPGADIAVSGLSRDDRNMHVVLGVSLTCDDGAVLAALRVANDVFDQLAVYSPHYVGPPEPEAARAARGLPRRFTARSSPMSRQTWEELAHYEQD